MLVLENSLAWSTIQALSKRLPPGWSVRLLTAERRDAAATTVQISGPGTSAHLRAWVASRLSPRAAQDLGRRTPKSRPELVLARFLTPTTRERLREAGVGYVDLTGNVYITLTDPALFIETTGARRDPTPPPKGASLKGAKAGAVVRALCDFVPPVGVRQLADRAHVTPGYASRLVKLLAEETLLEREPRGPVLDVDFTQLLRRWADNYSMMNSNETRTLLDPRGASNTLTRLTSHERRYAITGSFGAAGLAPVAAPRLLVVFVDNVDRTAEELRLRPAETGANVILAEPFDPVVFERSWKKDGSTFAAPSQLVADLLTSPGRGPNEAEELLQWMSAHEDVWRAR